MCVGDYRSRTGGGSYRSRCVGEKHGVGGRARRGYSFALPIPSRPLHPPARWHIMHALVSRAPAMRAMRGSDEPAPDRVGARMKRGACTLLVVQLVGVFQPFCVQRPDALIAVPSVERGGRDCFSGRVPRFLSPLALVADARRRGDCLAEGEQAECRGQRSARRFFTLGTRPRCSGRRRGRMTNPVSTVSSSSPLASIATTDRMMRFDHLRSHA